MLQVVVQRGLELGIGLGLGVFFGQLVQRVHQGLGHEPAAEGSKPAQWIGALGEGERVHGLGCPGPRHIFGQCV